MAFAMIDALSNRVAVSSQSFLLWMKVTSRIGKIVVNRVSTTLTEVKFLFQIV